MSKYQTIQDIEQELQKGYALARLRSGDNQSLDRMQTLLDVLGNPQDKLRVVHVAGTSGKTSTAYFVAALLKAGGATKVGLTVSPHVISLSERLQINGLPISDSELCRHFEDFMQILGKKGYSGTYFELLICFVYWVFERMGVDYAVIETGLGGLHDSTNVADRSDKVCVITDIGFDHTAILGENIDLIAAQKAGIIHEQNAVFMIRQSAEITAEINKRVTEKHADLHILEPKKVEALAEELPKTLPAFQKRNWILATTAYLYIAERDGLELSPAINPERVVVPGRMEIHKLQDGSLLILDSAHNTQKISAFVASFSELFPGKKAATLIALKSDKDHVGFLKSLAPITNELIVTQFEVAQDVPLKSLTPDVIAGEADGHFSDVRIETDAATAYNLLCRLDSDIKLVVGSIYLLGQLKSGVL